MKNFKLSYIFDSWDIRTATIKASSLKEAKTKLRKKIRGKATSITSA